MLPAASWHMVTNNQAMSLTKKSILLLSLLFTSTDVAADVIAYEPFDYPLGSIEGWGDQAGFNGGWGRSDQDPSFISDVVHPGLTYPDLPTVGQSAGARTSLIDRARRFMDTNPNGAFQQYIENNGTKNVIGKDGTTLWMSFLLKGQGTAMNAVTVGDDEGRARSKVFFGRPFNRPFFGINWDRNFGDGDTVAKSTLDDDLHLFVARFNFGLGNQDSVDVYLDPTLANGQPASPNATAGPGDASFDRIHVFTHDAAVPALLDEIRFGTSFGAVTATRERVGLLRAVSQQA